MLLRSALTANVLELSGMRSSSVKTTSVDVAAKVPNSNVSREHKVHAGMGCEDLPAVQGTRLARGNLSNNGRAN